MFILLLSAYILYTLLFLLNIKSSIYWKIITISIPIPILFFNPIDTYQTTGFYVDTVRIFTEIDSFRDNGWYATDIYDNFILSKLYIYSFSFFDEGFDYLLPFINAFIIYFIALYMTYIISKKFDLSKRIVNFSLLYVALIFSYFNITTNIRYPLAIAIAFVLLFIDLVNIKHRILCFIGYFLLLMLHPGIIFIIILRLLVYLPKYCIIFLCALLIFLGNDIILSIISNIPFDVIVGLLGKISDYSSSDGLWDVTIYSLITYLTYNICFILLNIFLYLYLKKTIYNKYKYMVNFVTLLSFMGILGILSSISGLIGRAEELSRYFLCLYFFIYADGSNFKINERKYNNLKILIKLLYIFMLIYFFYNILTYTRVFII